MRCLNYLLMLVCFSVQGQDLRLTAVSQFDTETLEDCSSTYLSSNLTGKFQWCWNQISINQNTSGTSTLIEPNALRLTQEWAYDQAGIVNNTLRMYLNPTDNTNNHTPGNNGDAGNKRVEIFEASDDTYASTFTARKPAGWEEWLGWEMTMGDNYIPITQYHWLFYQNKPDDADSPGNNSPPFSLNVAGGVFSGIPASIGEVVLSTRANGNTGATVAYPTGVILQAGQTYKIVLHTIFGEGTTGLLQVWIDDVLVVDAPNIATLYTPTLGGGTNKFGIYNWNWGIQSRLDDILAQGVDHLELFFGNIKGERWSAQDAEYGSNRYTDVVP